MKIFIPFNVPSSKNSKIATAKGVFMSKTVRKYLQAIGIKRFSVSKKTVEVYKKAGRPNLFELSVAPLREYLKDKEPPHVIGFHFVRGSKHAFDFTNVAQIICDLLVAHGVIFDDNMDCLIPFPLQIEGAWYSYDKEKPGVVIQIN